MLMSKISKMFSDDVSAPQGTGLVIGQVMNSGRAGGWQAP
jgi:hypothetical protein